MRAALIIDVVNEYRCGLCAFQSATERGVLLHQFAKHPHDLADDLLERANEFKTPPFKTSDILICWKTGLVVSNCSCRKCTKERRSMTADDQNAEPLTDISRSQIRTDQQSNPHEPECTANDIYAQDCICQRLHVAYNRGRDTINNDAIIDGLGNVRQALTAAYAQGREDLANDIRAIMAPFYESPHGKYLAPLMSKLRSILINAGGH